MRGRDGRGPKAHAEGRSQARTEGHGARSVELDAQRYPPELQLVARQVKWRLVHVDMTGSVEGLRARVEVQLVGAEDDGDVLRRFGSRGS